MATNPVLQFFKDLFKSEKAPEITKHDSHLEPKYWQEVIDLRKRLEEVIKENTIDHDNISQVNKTVIDYYFEQINTKGSLPTINERYAALNTLADRILMNYQSKIVGLKKNVTTHTDFSDAVNDFKHRLDQRKEKELSEERRPVGPS